MRTIRFYLILFLLPIFQLQAQTATTKPIATILNDYFRLDRENIHVHLNKSTYLTNERIRFKGYVVEKKDRLPYSGTSNIYAALYDAAGTKVLTKLILCYESLFQGDIKLDKSFKSGKYYLQLYTNYMNNFAEDESSVYEINILNTNESQHNDLTKINYDDIRISMFPESDVFVQDISNTFAIKITDCNENGIPVSNGRIVDAKGNTVTNFSTNALGYGKFDILSARGEIYKALFTINGAKHEKALPMPVWEGIALSVNNYTFPDKTIIKLKTNERTIKNKTNDVFTLIIQQNEKMTSVDFSFKEKLEQTLSLEHDLFSEGINVVRLIDKNRQEYAKRVVYSMPAKIPKLNDLYVVQTRNDSIIISGNSQATMPSLSISVLPSDAVLAKKDMHSALQFDPYLDTPTMHAHYFLSDLSRRKQYELDNYLITKQSKYKWTTLIGEAPSEKYEFDRGLTVKGTINNNISNKEQHKISMISLRKELSVISDIDSKNQFLFENVIVMDSSLVYFTLLNKREKIADLKQYSQILKNNRQFLKPLAIKPACASHKESDARYTFPKLHLAINLDSITINSKKPKAATQENMYGNRLDGGYKIDPAEAGFRNIVDFIGDHGYNIRQTSVGATITNTFSRSISGGAGSPAIFIDNMYIDDISILTTYRLSDVDMVYFNKRGLDTGFGGSNGTIRIYMRKGYSRGSKVQVKTQSLLVQNGFAFAHDFENPEYENYHDSSFKKFGTIHWIPETKTDKAGHFKFAIPNMNQESVVVVIEGIATNGAIISETTALQIE